MAVKIGQLKEIFTRTFAEFLEREKDGLLVGINERNSCARLANFLERHAHDEGLREYVADVEYNRKQGGEIKTILAKGMTILKINPDVILHSRGAIIAEDNLIAIEMKKHERPESEKLADRERLRVMTRRSYDGVWSNDGTTHPEHVCGYRLGVFIEINSGQRAARVEYFVGGRRSKNFNQSF